MFPELFDFLLPDFLVCLLGVAQLTVYTYAALIVVGTLVATLYTKWRVKKELGVIDFSNTFFSNMFIAEFFGGKLFYD